RLVGVRNRARLQPAKDHVQRELGVARSHRPAPLPKAALHQPSSEIRHGQRGELRVDLPDLAARCCRREYLSQLSNAILYQPEQLRIQTLPENAPAAELGDENAEEIAVLLKVSEPRHHVGSHPFAPILGLRHSLTRFPIQLTRIF